MKFLTKIHNPKVHPLSKKIVDITTKVLYAHGIENTIVQAKCSLEFFKLTILNAKEIQSATARGCNTDELLQSQSEKYKVILAKYGITDNDEQETIILEYLDAIVTIGE